MKLTLGQAARQAGISKSYLSRLIKSGKISGERQENGELRIDPSELDRRSRTCSLRIMFRDLSHTAWARGISQSYTLPTSFQSPCPPLCPSLYAHPSRSLPRSSTGILC
jgi:excisionase family DNA binding protein